jgi:hypothetical protein
MNNFLSPVVLVFFVFSEAMMCLSTFQLALVSEKSYVRLPPVLVFKVKKIIRYIKFNFRARPMSAASSSSQA